MSRMDSGKQPFARACWGLAALLLAVGCASPVPRFTDDTQEAGLFYRGRGKCIALGDINADGQPDIYACVVYGEDRFFLNRGDGTFRDETASLKPVGDGHGAAFVDLNNDGHTDLFVACNPESGSQPPVQPNRLYLGPAMKEVARAAGIDGELIAPKPDAPALNRSCGVAIGDYDNDGDLDIYVAKGSYESGYPNALYENRLAAGELSFVDVAERAGVVDLGAGTAGGGYVCAFADFDDDGFLDLFIGNLDLNNKGVGLRLFRNKGDGTFADVSEQTGVTGSGMCTGCAVGDVDNDGDLDLLVTFGDAKRPSALYLNDGRFRFRERAVEVGLGDKLSARGCCLGDVDNDGDLDILIAEFFGGKLYVNQGDGTFREGAEEAGISNPGMHGCTFGDMDNDGDLDFYTTNWYMSQLPQTGGFLFFRNQRNDGNWLKVQVEGTTSNRSAVGARVSVYEAGHAGDKAHLRGFREIASGSGVFSSPPLIQHFGLDGRKTYDVVVYFPMTKRNVVLRGVAAAQMLNVTEPAQ